MEVSWVGKYTVLWLRVTVLKFALVIVQWKCHDPDWLETGIPAPDLAPARPVILGKSPSLLILSIWKELFSPTNFLTSLMVKTWAEPHKWARFRSHSSSVNHLRHVKGGLALSIFHRLRVIMLKGEISKLYWYSVEKRAEGYSALYPLLNSKHRTQEKLPQVSCPVYRC